MKKIKEMTMTNKQKKLPSRPEVRVQTHFLFQLHAHTAAVHPLILVAPQDASPTQ